MKIFKCITLILLLVVTEHKFEDIFDSCTRNRDCGTKNSICSNGKCSCDNISYNGTDGCLPYVTKYKSYCEEKKQCDWLGNNSDCVKNQCICKENYFWYQGSCQLSVNKGDACTSVTDCNSRGNILSMQCSGSDGNCICAEGYYDRKYDCRKKSSEGNACALDIDCQSKNLSCTLGKCSPTKQPDEKVNYNIEYSSGISKEKTKINTSVNISCTYDEDCRDMANSFCDPETSSCACDKNTQYFYDGNCLPGFGSCPDEDCAQWKNSMCFKNSCVCAKGFFLHEGTCIAEIGMPDPSLKTDKDCVIKPGQLVKRTGVDPACVCKTYWFNDDTNRNCIKTMIQDISSCLTNEWCEAMGPNSFCNSTTKKCQCSSFATLDESNYYCEAKKEPKGCLRDSNCKLNEECIDEKCQCIENYFKNGNECVTGIGGSCDTDITSCSHVANSRCKQGVCTCLPNFTPKTNRCFKLAENLNDSCEIQEQCQTIKYTQCGPQNDQNKTCTCGDGYTEIDDYCMKTKEYGDACMKNTDCTLVLNHSFKCRNSRCQCPLGSKLKDGYCISSSTKYSLAVSLLFLCILNFWVNI